MPRSAEYFELSRVRDLLSFEDTLECKVGVYRVCRAKQPQQELQSCGASEKMKRVISNRNENGPVVDYFSKALLALTTFSPTVGCSTSSTGDRDDDQRDQIMQKAIESQRERQISALGEFIHDPDPQVLLDACRKAFSASGIEEPLALDPSSGRVQILRNSIYPDGINRREFSDLFSPEQELVVSQKDGSLFIRYVVQRPDGVEVERYESIGNFLKNPKKVGIELGDGSFDKLSAVADSGLRDGVISEGELRQAIKNPQIQGEDAQLVAAFFKNYSAIQFRGDGLHGVSSGDCLALMLLDNAPLGVKLNNYIVSSGAIVGNATSLYGVKGYPTPFDAAAGFASNNGHLIAVINALCAARPDAIGEMIKPSSSGSGFEVRFGSKTVEVPVPTESEVITFTTCGNDGYWMAVLVKAYGQLVGEARGTSEINPESNFSNGDSLGSLGKLMENLSRHPIRKLSLGLFGSSADSLHKELVKAAADNRAVCLATSNKARLGGESRIGGIILEVNQVYAVVGYDPKTREVTILNPRRKITNNSLPEDLSDGVEKISLAKLMNKFRAVFIEGGDPSKQRGKGLSASVRFPQ
jgi:hypothetical protein